RSSSMLSRNWSCFSRADSVPVFSSSRSASVDFPWSMWAMIEKFRRCAFSAGMERAGGAVPVTQRREGVVVTRPRSSGRMEDSPLLKADGALVFSSPESFRRHYEQYLDKGGALVRPEAPLQPLEVLQVRIALPFSGELALEAQVTNLAGSLALLHFTNLSEDDAGRLRRAAEGEPEPGPPPIADGTEGLPPEPPSEELLREVAALVASIPPEEPPADLPPPPPPPTPAVAEDLMLPPQPQAPQPAPVTPPPASPQPDRPSPAFVLLDSPPARPASPVPAATPAPPAPVAAPTPGFVLVGL